ncbi:MAG TPA: hypothetical protein VIT91_19030 [Chthoniobacterales bacterium]
MLKIRFAVTGLGRQDVKIPNDIESPVPFVKGDTVFHYNSDEHRLFEVYSVQWVVDDRAGTFYQVASIGAPQA